MSDLREKIMATKRDRRRVPVLVPAWGQTVYVRELSASEMDELELFFNDEREAAKKAGRAYRPCVRGGLMVACTCDGEGKDVFDAQDSRLVGEWPYHEVEPLLTTINQVNKVTKAAQEELEKKFETAGGSGSAPGSPSGGESATPPG